MSIKLKNIEFGYKRGENVVRDFSLEVKSGEIVALLGESGSGKSTILRLIAGLEVPGRGSIEVFDKVMVDNEIFIQPERRGIGIVFQDYALFPHMSVIKNIEFAVRGSKKSIRSERIKEILDLVRLNEFGKRYPYELSGGQQQRVALARAIASEAKIILMDEPFSNLDTHLKEEIRSEIRELIKKIGITMIFVTHDKEDSKALADRAVVINHGKKEEEGEPEKVYER